LSFDPTANGQVYGYVALGVLLEHESGTGGEIPDGSHVHLYKDVANAAIAYGDLVPTNANTYVSLANPEGCAKCHGSPYLKHGYRAAEVAGTPDFAAGKVCHNDDVQGGHEDWQWIVDDPAAWGANYPNSMPDALKPQYAYFRNVMNDVHMSHAMEFPYPMSMSNCSTCHEGNEAAVTADTFFTPETCKSCHPVQGLNAWPEDAGTTLEGLYAQPHRAPPLQFLWARANVSAVHAPLDLNDPATTCASASCHGGNFSSFGDHHSGWDDHIYDDTGTKFSAMPENQVSIDSVTLAGNLLTVDFSVTNTAIVPELLVSFYGWDTKNFIVGSHTRDASDLCFNFRRDPPTPSGCRYEYVPESSGGTVNNLFIEEAGSVPGAWSVTADLAAYLPNEFWPLDIPTQIADGIIKKIEVTITPELKIAGEDVVLTASNATLDIATGTIDADYFKGANAVVSTAKCNVCHDTLASTFHDGSGRGGDGIEVCKNCHVTTNPGSHLEQSSRAIDSYVHAIHSFLPFDGDDVFDANDPVFNAWNDLHKNHTFPNFTIRNCEACHVEPGALIDPTDDPVTGARYPAVASYNVPDQSKSMFGVLSKSYDIPTRAIGNIPEYVTGPASRACGGCHRADFINADAAGELASWNAHTDAFGTLEENDSDDLVLYGIIGKIMSLFE
jgi:OmcA/MtrC family decaheme c-type cytochrome